MHTKIFIDHLQISAIIGIHPYEHNSHQPIYIDIELDVENHINPVKDQLEETIDYEAIAKMIEILALKCHVQLVETLAHRIANECLKYDNRIQKIWIKISKPNALADAKYAGVIFTKEKQD